MRPDEYDISDVERCAKVVELVCSKVVVRNDTENGRRRQGSSNEQKKHPSHVREFLKQNDRIRSLVDELDYV